MFTSRRKSWKKYRNNLRYIKAELPNTRHHEFICPFQPRSTLRWFPMHVQVKRGGENHDNVLVALSTSQDLSRRAHRHRRRLARSQHPHPPSQHHATTHRVHQPPAPHLTHHRRLLTPSLNPTQGRFFNALHDAGRNNGDQIFSFLWVDVCSDYAQSGARQCQKLLSPIWPDNVHQLISADRLPSIRHQFFLHSDQISALLFPFPIQNKIVLFLFLRFNGNKSSTNPTPYSRPLQPNLMTVSSVLMA